jgi:hypothetical protein
MAGSQKFSSISLVIFLGLLVVCAVPLKFTIVHAIDEAINLSQTDSASVFPQIVVSDNDDIHVVWQDTEPGQNDIFVSSSMDGGNNYGERIDISNTESASTNAQGASSGDEVYVTWQDASFGTTDILVSTSTDGGETFGSPVNVSDNELDSSLPQIALSTTGTIYVVWQDLSFGNSEIFFSSSTDGGSTFGTPINVSNNDESSSNARIVATGDARLYVAWQDSQSGTTDIYVATSTDGGSTFGTPINVSNNELGSSLPQIAVSGSGDSNDHVHITWQDQTPGNQDILATTSTDGGSTFGTPINVSNMEGASQSPRIAIAPDNADAIHLVWHDSVSGTSDIYISTSTDGGSTFGTPIDVSNTADNISTNGRIAVFESDNIFVTWQELTDDNGNEIFFTSSTDGGSTFGGSLDLSNTADSSTNLQMGLSSGGALHVVWQDATSGGGDILIQSNFQASAATISIDNITTESPKWGSLIEASGTVTNAIGGDTVKIDWGDGTSTTDVPISNSTWGPVSHTYDSSAIATSPNLLVAKLIASDATTKATSSTIEVNVQKHTTVLSLASIASVKQGEDLLVTGSLVDLDDEDAGIGDKTVAFSGSGADNLGAASTRVDGSFSTIGASPSSAEDSWIVQAFFDGSLDPLYESTESKIMTYDTAETSASEYEVDEGMDVNVNITGFDFKASVNFENVVTAGSLYVSLCESLDRDDRFIPLSPIDMCLRISPGISMAEGSGANVTISFANADLPDGFDSNDISIFHDDAVEGTIIDVTKARDLDEESITGTVTRFSEFIVALSLHEEKPQGSHRQQVFIGDDNEVSLRDINAVTNSSATVTSSFDKSSYRRSDNPILTITDSSANVDSTEVDIITAGVMSDTSDPIAITITLEETGADTGIFEGSFSLSGAVTSDLTDTLEVSSGDGLSAFYISGGRFSSMIDDVTEAGLAEMNDMIVDSSVCFRPIGGAVELKLVDAQLGEVVKITATMSYRNAIFQPGDEFALLDFFYRQDSSWDLAQNIVVDEDAMTVTAEAPAAGGFSLGYDTGCGGGSGGGLGRPGTGIVLDFVASISRSSGGSGGSSSPNNNDQNTGSSTSMSSGQSVSSRIDIEDSEQDVGLLFENVVIGGTVSVLTKDPSDLTDLFDSLQTEGSSLSSSPSQGLIAIYGTNSMTIGNVYDIGTSPGFIFEANVVVTIPYDESLVLQSGASESDVRLLHHNGSQWEDRTISVDELNNTVTGQLSSLSPVVAAVLEDGTYDALYLQVHPLDGVIVEDASFLIPQSGPTVGQVIDVGATVKNLYRANQSYAFVVQIEDENGVTIFIDWVAGTLLRGETMEMAINWTANGAGNYIATILIWDSDPNSSETIKPIAQKTSITILQVTGLDENSGGNGG